MVNILGNIARVPAHWFRIAYSRNAFLRSLAGPLEALTPARAVAAMLAFQRDYRPQHAESDELRCAWGPRDGVFEFALERRMHRHGHSPATLSLALAFALTPARDALAGSAPGTDSRSTPGYRAIARAAVLDRTVTLRGGEPLSS
jgi:hypothetical protein